MVVDIVACAAADVVNVVDAVDIAAGGGEAVNVVDVAVVATGVAAADFGVEVDVDVMADTEVVVVGVDTTSAERGVVGVIENAGVAEVAVVAVLRCCSCSINFHNLA